MKTTVRPLPNAKQRPEHDHDPSSPWVALDRFIREMESNRHVPDRFSTALATVCDSTNAQLAFVYTEGAGGAIEMAGAETPSPRWCRDLTHGLLAKHPCGGLWHADGRTTEFELSPGPIPRSAVVLPVEPQRPSWIVAVSIDSEQPMDECDFRIIKVIWRLLLNNKRNVRHYENLKETLFGVVR